MARLPDQAPRRYALLLFVAGLLSSCAGQPIRSDLSEAERREDLQFVATVFAEREQSFTPESRALFEARVAEIGARITTMSRAEFVAGIQWAVAAAGNLEPDVSIPLTFNDYASGRDPAMARVPSILGNAASSPRATQLLQVNLHD